MCSKKLSEFISVSRVRVYILAEKAYLFTLPHILSALFLHRRIWYLASLVFILVDSWCIPFWRIKKIYPKITNDIFKSKIHFAYGIWCYHSIIVGEKFEMCVSEMPRNALNWIQLTTLVPKWLKQIVPLDAYFFPKVHNVLESVPRKGAHSATMYTLDFKDNYSYQAP